jgi:short-subunit dehydrogenase
MRVIVTGATKGIGKSISSLFVSKGWDLVGCSRNEDDLASLKEALLQIDPNREILTYKADLSKKTETEAFGAFILQEWKDYDVLINNAGVFIPGEIHNEEEGMLEKMIETNLYSAYHLTRKLISPLLLKKKGHIINICSIASLFAYPNGGSYSISKFALLGFSKVLREELKDKGIKVTSILPGGTWSNSWAGATLPRARLIEPEDIAKVVWNAVELGDSAVVEEIIIRPQLGDL